MSPDKTTALKKISRTPSILVCLLFLVVSSWMSSPQMYYFYSFMMLLFYISTIYILFSYWMWFYGGSFSCRVLVQTYPFLALPIALLLKRVYLSRRKWISISFSIILTLGIALNIIQSYQYNKGIIHWDSKTWECYWKVFLSLEYWHGHGL